MDQDIIGNKSRQFICSCGKNYLSYAALFTHIKQKHDGKVSHALSQAPGPIVRPRSERKRGRPRKNQQEGENDMSSEESNIAQNGILKLQNDNINNNQQKIEQFQKTKKAAQLLGCGGFVAFTAYKPQLIRPLQKKQTQSGSGKKNTARKSSSFHENIERKISSSYVSLGQIQSHAQIGISHSTCSIQKQKNSILSFCQQLQLQNKLQFKNIFKVHPQQTTGAILSVIKQKQLEIFKKINVNYENPDKLVSYFQQTPIAIGISQFLYEVRKMINNDQQDYKPSDEKQQFRQIKKQQKSQENQIKFEQILLLVAFLLKYIVEVGPYGVNQLQQKSILDITEYLSKFALQYLPAQMKSFQVGNFNFDLFTSFNPVKFMLFLNNWLTIKKIKIQSINLSPTQKSKIESYQEIKHQNDNQIKNQSDYKIDQKHQFQTQKKKQSENYEINHLEYLKQQQEIQQFWQNSNQDNNHVNQLNKINNDNKIQDDQKIDESLSKPTKNQW